jgi:hypothetical protein
MSRRKAKPIRLLGPLASEIVSGSGFQQKGVLKGLTGK